MSEPTPAPDTVQIGIGAQYIKDISFENPQAPHIFNVTDKNPEMDMGVNVQAKPLGSDGHEVILSIKLTTKIDERIIYIAELAYAGVFVVPAIMNEDAKRMFLMTEAPRLLFPFARSILANLVREGGFNPVMLNPIDFTALYMANKDKIGMMQPAGAA